MFTCDFIMSSNVFRFDLKNSNVNDPHLEKMSGDSLADVVLVKKVYAEKSVRNRRRKWRLKHMEGLHQAGSSGSMSDGGNEYNDFLEDLEEDPELRKNVNVYKDAAKISGEMPVDQESISDGDIPQITLAEMLDDLDIGSHEAKNVDEDDGTSETPMME